MTKELMTILDAVETHGRLGRRMALATIVGVRGSTYRREGARLLVTEHQEMVGNISGGCLESDVMVVGEDVMTSGVPRLVTYDLTADDDVVWGLGLGCNGAVDVFVEPVEPSSEVFKVLRMAITQERTVSVLTVVGGAARLGARMVVHADGSRVGTLGNPVFDDRAARAAAASQREGTSRVQSLSSDVGDVRIFVEVNRPPIRLVICGAGHDAIPVVQFASALGWRVVVVDQRERFLTPQRFPSAPQFVHVDPAAAATQVPLDDRTYVVIMTHNFVHDRDLLRGFLRTDARYLGVLGPKIRTQKILDELHRDGGQITPRDLERIYAPLGLDIGSDGPEEIACAIIGEILAVESGRSAGFLRARAGSIHQDTKAVGRGS